MNNDGSAAGCSDVTSAGPGDYLGYYGGTGTSAPAAANVTIPHSGTYFNFNLRTVANTAANSFTATPTTGAPTARASHSAVWTGTEMIIWGGADSLTSYAATGARYNPVTDAWTPTSTIGAPPARMFHSAVWTGTRMIIWGGGTSISDMTTTNTGGLYDPATDSWTATSTAGAPAARVDNVAVWTGSKMIVWGGDDGTSTFGDSSSQRFNTGGVYDPATDTWSAVSTTGAPSGRNQSAAVWTGSEMIVWGGADGSNLVNTGGRYNPASNTWTTTTTTNAPALRSEHSLVWTGTKMIVWGGHSWASGSGDIDVNTGVVYDPTSDTWTATSLTGAPAVRNEHVAFWTGSRMLVWGGEDRITDASLDTGGLYDPAADSWTATTTVDAPVAHHEFSAVWTGTEMLVWGGVNSDTNPNPPIVYNDGGRYRP